jgi:threonine dehydrogenase-like Zn-dependent dehydrogenase
MCVPGGRKVAAAMWSVYLDTSPMRAAVTRALGVASRRAYFGPLAPLRARRIRQTELPGPKWVRVRNSMAGISSADVARVLLQTDRSVSPLALPRQPRVYLGREVCGEVVEAGPEVDFLRVGDRVAYQYDQCCATREIEPPCSRCAAGSFNLCENRYLPGPQAIGGGWGDEMIVHERQLFLVPDTLSDEQAALLESTAAALHAVLRHQPQPGESVLVIGAGTLGLLTTQVLRGLSPNTLITVEARHPFQAEMASTMGASHLLSPAEGSAGVARYTGAKRFSKRGGAELLIGGFDAVYDTVGTEDSLQRALHWVRAGGAVVLAGAHLGRMRLDLTPVWHQEVRLFGALEHGSERWPGDTVLSGWAADSGGRVSTFALAAALMRERRLAPQLLITHRFPLREVRNALAVVRDEAEHHAVKVLLDIRDVSNIPLADLEFAEDPLQPQPSLGGPVPYSQPGARRS